MSLGDGNRSLLTKLSRWLPTMLMDSVTRREWRTSELADMELVTGS